MWEIMLLSLEDKIHLHTGPVSMRLMSNKPQEEKTITYDMDQKN